MTSVASLPRGYAPFHVDIGHAMAGLALAPRRHVEGLPAGVDVGLLSDAHELWGPAYAYGIAPRSAGLLQTSDKKSGPTTLSSASHATSNKKVGVGSASSAPRKAKEASVRAIAEHATPALAPAPAMPAMPSFARPQLVSSRSTVPSGYGFGGVDMSGLGAPPAPSLVPRRLVRCDSLSDGDELPRMDLLASSDDEEPARAMMPPAPSMGDAGAMTMPPPRPPQLLKLTRHHRSSSATFTPSDAGVAGVGSGWTAESLERYKSERKQRTLERLLSQYRCDKPECALTLAELLPPVLERQQAFAFKEDVMVTCPKCGDKSSVNIWF